jgi:Protein of unknown function (DUF3828)
MNLRRLLVAALLALSPMTAATADSPAQHEIHTFLAAIYAHYRGGNSTYDPTGAAAAPQLFTAEVVSLLRENQDLAAKGGNSALDSDPFCDCQDDAGMKVAIGAIAVTGPADATATVNLRLSNGNAAPVKDAITISLRRENGKWRVQDIVSGLYHQSFLAYLRSENRTMKAETTKKP